MRNTLLAFAVMLVLVIGGVAQPLVERARAATPHQDTVPGPAAVAQKVYGPVDQSAPLDFSTQPAAVPRTYVPGRTYNVQALPQKDYAYVLGVMAKYTTALGVSCTYCHNAGNFAYDTATKKVARQMIVMSSRVNSQWIDPVHKDYPDFKVAGAVGCVTCHRGQPVVQTVGNVVPVQYLDWPAKSTRQDGVVVNSMYTVARSLGVNCLFCHNSADFKSLQYYPTNRIAHRMWQMVDAINHQYLGPDVPAVTCYSCHQGAKYPSALVASSADQTTVEAVPARPEVHANPALHAAPVGAGAK